MERFDVVFAGLYFDSVEAAAAGAGADVARSWAPLVAARRRWGVASTQFALAGMNAHINYDHAVAVVTMCRRARREPATMHDDYERINELLATVVRPIRQSFLDSLVVEVGTPLSPLADLVSACWSGRAADAGGIRVANRLWHRCGCDELKPDQPGFPRRGRLGPLKR
jgi:Family of unknown function (DUF5995)